MIWNGKHIVYKLSMKYSIISTYKVQYSSILKDFLNPHSYSNVRFGDIIIKLTIKLTNQPTDRPTKNLGADWLCNSSCTPHRRFTVFSQPPCRHDTIHQLEELPGAGSLALIGLCVRNGRGGRILSRAGGTLVGLKDGRLVSWGRGTFRQRSRKLIRVSISMRLMPPKPELVPAAEASAAAPAVVASLPRHRGCNSSVTYLNLVGMSGREWGRERDVKRL